jgi:signal transduction histidine kinase
VEHEFQADIDAITALPAVRTILTVVCKITGMGFAAVARVTEDRWIACAVHDDIAFGLKPGGELKVDSTICHEIRESGRAVVIDHVAESAIWRDHHTPLQYGLQSYISFPIILRDGRFFGTLCAIDPKPARLDNPEIISMFEQFADLISYHLDAHERLITSQASLMDERKTAELREQFIAVLGHDLRNPLASISGGARLLMKEQPSEKAQTILKMMQASVGRMTGLIGDVLDFARGRLGGGFAVDVAEENLQSVLAQVAGELSGEHPDREIDMEIAVSQPVHCDRARLGQLFSNLLGNALAHGARDKPIRVRASTGGSFFELSVGNAGEQILPAAIPQLFQPFVRGAVTPSQQGLGLGLYIASEIARAHGGTLVAESTPEETRFTFRMPL